MRNAASLLIDCFHGFIKSFVQFILPRTITVFNRNNIVCVVYAVTVMSNTIGYNKLTYGNWPIFGFDKAQYQVPIFRGKFVYK